MKKTIPTRHGELLLLPITADCDMTSAVKKTRYVASHSETGHHHIIEGTSLVLEREGHDTLIKLSDDGEITHQKSTDKHDTMPLRKGIYRLLKKKEYDPFAKAMREVWD